MSGPELALAIMPLIIEAIKSYSTVTKGISTFKNYSTEITLLVTDLRVQNDLFVNEVHLLLRLVADNADIEAILKDPDDQWWAHELMDARLRAVLHHDFGSCRTIVREVNEILEGLKDDIEDYSSPLRNELQSKISLHSYKGRVGAEAYRRFRSRIKMVFRKPEYEQRLAKLRNKNIDLSAFRSQHNAFQQTQGYNSAPMMQHIALPVDFSVVRNTSQSFYDALCQYWCCSNATHQQHQVKLRVYAEAYNEVELDLAISSQDPLITSDSRLSQEPPIWLYVKSVGISGSNNKSKNTRELFLDLQRSLLPGAHAAKTVRWGLQESAVTPRGASKTILAQNTQRLDQTTSSATVASTQSTSVDLAESNLIQESDICQYLKSSILSSSIHATKCLGFLETPQVYRHMLYKKPKWCMPPDTPLTAIATVHSLKEIVGITTGDLFTIPDRLKIAHRVALAVLRFNGTSWLREHWRLMDLGYFMPGGKFDEAALETLHLNSDIASSPSLPRVPEVRDVLVEASEDLKHGVKNPTLFHLGMALLEIAHRRSMEDLRLVHDCNTNTFTARRVSIQPSCMGPKYDMIVEKCLSCDFGFGSRLDSRPLQGAIYSNVVHELERMFKSLEA